MVGKRLAKSVHATLWSSSVGCQTEVCRGLREGATIVSSAFRTLFAEALQSAVNSLVVDEEKEAVHRQLISVAEID